MRAFPTELATLLGPEGRALLRGAHPAAGALGREGRRFVQLPALLAPQKARGCLALLEHHFPPLLRPMETPIPPEATWGMVENYGELLPKASRVRTALLDSRRARAWQVAQRLGLLRMLRSATFHQLAERLAGRPLQRRWGVQLLCYGPGDYVGPHNDHHPEDAEARDGYVDLHLTLCNAAVGRQLLVYERRGHLSEVAEVATLGGLNAYRLPFWHYTTPLEPRPDVPVEARRWVLLGTFLDATAGASRRSSRAPRR
ncbi:MAG: hypothetical protein FJ086_05180 [Deltaproteobacteria bacterium]|nr:hypothetical protein [Deltaproteobacteria bacterium]